MRIQYMKAPVRQKVSSHTDVPMILIKDSEWYNTVKTEYAQLLS